MKTSISTKRKIEEWKSQKWKCIVKNLLLLSKKNANDEPVKPCSFKEYLKKNERPVNNKCKRIQEK